MLGSGKRLTVRASAITTTRKIPRLRASFEEKGVPTDLQRGYHYFHRTKSSAPVNLVLNRVLTVLSMQQVRSIHTSIDLHGRTVYHTQFSIVPMGGRN